MWCDYYILDLYCISIHHCELVVGIWVWYGVMCGVVWCGVIRAIMMH